MIKNLYQFKDSQTQRISSYQRTGENQDYIIIGAGETVDIFNVQGPGIIRHIWITFGHADPMARRNLILRMYWDDEKKPSVESPLGDFFGQGWGESYNWSSLLLAAAPKQGKSLNCFFPMPFAKRGRIEIENDSDQPCEAFYYYVDYEVPSHLEEDTLYFHSQWQRQITAPVGGDEAEWRLWRAEPKNLTDKLNHIIIDVKGRGQYIGVNYFVDCPTPMWYGEGDDMFFVDGKPWPPSIHGTGTEDYFCGAYCPKEVYCHPFFGYARVNDNIGHLGRTHCYRFLIENPIRFNKSLRGSIETGHANCLTLDIATVAYWYQSEPHKVFTAFPERAQRQNMPSIGACEIHRWREAWRQLLGKGKLWGHEPLPENFAKKLAKKARKQEHKLAPDAALTASENEARKQRQMLHRRKRPLT